MSTSRRGIVEKMKKIACFNNKGGVGKSTIAVQLAHGLSKSDYKVLLIDLDSQNDCSLFLGVDDEGYNKTFFDLIDYRYPAKLEECIIPARNNLYLLPNSRYDLIEKDFHREPRIDVLLEDKLSEVESYDFDYIIIDCSPSRGIINDAILYYVDNLVIPVQLEAASIRGIADIYSYLEDLKVSTSKIKVIVPNMYDQRTNETKENLKQLKAIFKGQDVLSEPVYRRIKIAEATKVGKTIYEYDDTAQKQFYNVLERVANIG